MKVSRPIWSSTTLGDAAAGQRRHGADEVLAVADDPGGAHHVVPRCAGHRDVAGGLGLAVDAERAERLVLVVTWVPSKTYSDETWTRVMPCSAAPRAPRRWSVGGPRLTGPRGSRRASTAVYAAALRTIVSDHGHSSSARRRSLKGNDSARPAKAARGRRRELARRARPSCPLAPMTSVRRRRPGQRGRGGALRPSRRSRPPPAGSARRCRRWGRRGASAG